MTFDLVPLRGEHRVPFMRDMQAAFQQGAQAHFGELPGVILPEEHITSSLAAEGSVALEAIVDGELVGGAVVVIDESSQHNHLDLLYVRNGVHSRGIGQAIWWAIEARFPETRVWETVTPYFERRNIHFYVNVCGFHIVEFYNERHPDPHDPRREQGDGSPTGDLLDGSFRFEKQMRP